MQTAKHVFIVNPIAGKKDAGRQLIPGIEAAAAACAATVEIELTVAPRHATEIARRRASAGAPVRLYSVGGDGTFNEVLAGAHPFPNAAVGAVPCGSGNDFIRNFPPASRFLNIPAQLSAPVMPIDLMQVDGGIGAAITSVGLDAEVAYGIPRYRRIPLLGGSMAYTISIVERLFNPLGRQVRIQIDDEVFEGRYLIAAVCNSSYYGGGFCAAPMARLDDGFLDVILVQKISRLKVANIIGKYKQGKHFQNGEVIPVFRPIMVYRRAKEVTITPAAPPIILNVDGECGPAPRLYAKVLPLAARFIVPPAEA